ncbi:MAG: hypothetical protein AAGE05_13465 [Pseudomonadota bacterium]
MQSAAGLIEEFELFLTGRMREFREPVRTEFAALFDAIALQNDGRLHIEVYTDSDGFDFHLCQFDEKNMEIKNAHIHLFNNNIRAIWPIVQPEEMDRFWIWEEDPKWGRQVALEQPIDNIDLAQIVIPWFRGIVLETRGHCRDEVTLALHDLTPSMPLC